MRIANSLLFALLFLSGCVTRRNVAGDPRYPTDYRLGQIYHLRQARFLDQTLFVKRPGATGGVPRSVEEYNMEGAARWFNMVALLPAGTRLEIASIVLEKNPESGNLVWVGARILDGQMSGRLIDLMFASRMLRRSSPLAAIPQVDPEILE
jgi:hypothetical protein